MIAVFSLVKLIFGVSASTFFRSKNACHLNRNTREEFAGDFVPRPGGVYINMVVREFNPCTKIRCKHGGKCVSSPLVHCVCPSDFTGRRCQGFCACIIICVLSVMVLVGFWVAIAFLVLDAAVVVVW